MPTATADRSRSPPAKLGSSGSPKETLKISGLNGHFGGLVETRLTAAQLLGADSDPSDARTLAQQLVRAWQDFGGLLVLRGLEGISAAEFAELSAFFGQVEPELDDSKKKYRVEGVDSVMRIGNTRDLQTGSLTSLNAKIRPLPEGGSPQYCRDSRSPVWHTDSTYREHPPIGSLLYCKQAPPEGGATCFADMRRAYEALDTDTKKRLDGLECVCSQAHHDAKVHSYSPDFPVLTPEERAANPPRRVPMVLQHPLTDVPALYGMNSSTCAVLPKGTPIPDELMDSFELNAVEDPSVENEWRSLLPFVTSDQFTVVWKWQPGDLVVWDNRSTLHCATGFDAERYTREMWRTTLMADLGKTAV
eukprot:TRINITY_DN113726_c0_g1_i1.p1 TRINITY_DN113726_c0_g1~~TRINITY_DN113726_c0_g1_i1.p1  ORF type:complete len:370 (-),score=49.32 TRINITY_DN113726_c0_g1_i1:138-1220(-)